MSINTNATSCDLSNSAMSIDSLMSDREMAMRGYHVSSRRASRNYFQRHLLAGGNVEVEVVLTFATEAARDEAEEELEKGTLSFEAAEIDNLKVGGTAVE